jgi:ribonuclease P protein component
MKNTFKKTERLTSRKDFERVFTDGKSFFVYPYKVFCLVIDEDQPYPAKVAISVPKKKIKRAVDRNKQKRLFKEAYRNLKSQKFYNELNNYGTTIALLFVFVGDEKVKYSKIFSTIEKCFTKIISDISKN